VPQADCTEADCIEASTAAILRMEAIAIAAGSSPWIGVGRAVGSTVVGYNIVAAEAVGHNIVVDSLCTGAADSNTAVVAAVDSLCCSEAVGSNNFGVVGNTVVAVVGSLCCFEAVGSSTAVVAVVEVVEVVADRPDNKAADKRFHNFQPVAHSWLLSNQLALQAVAALAYLWNMGLEWGLALALHSQTFGLLEVLQ